MKRALFLVVLISLPSCQKEEIVPVVLQSETAERFSTCFPGDGGLRVSVDKNAAKVDTIMKFRGQKKQGDVALEKIQLDWLAKKNGEWTVEVTDPLGRKLIRLHYNLRAIEETGPLRGRIPHVAVNKNKMLQLDNHDIGIRVDEIPCLLAFRTPQMWAHLVTKAEQHLNKDVLLIESNSRNIKNVFYGKKKDQPKKTCALISWSSFLGLHTSKIMWCYQLKEKKKSAYLFSEGLGALFWEDDGY
jgi:hypothetical protein